MRLVLNRAELQVTVGDLLEAEVDAIVNPANSLMIMGGGVAGAIKRVEGEEIEKEAMRYAPVPIGRAVVTRTRRLKAKLVIHAPTVERPGGSSSTDAVRAATLAALAAAREEGVRSLALPLLGAGVGGLSADVSAETMLKALRESPWLPERVVIVVRGDAYELATRGIERALR
ncbi:MAG: macro domain-containing protein [Acidilobaceae archaeon]|nr:macro domain-containing protein [Acidilobaceae archaeon]MCX8165518.1 macro domain-containing protein [Acidilobaceae archaeon]MDW7973945.1 macro domain-containing protein [Sulfolobales archaeon]